MEGMLSDYSYIMDLIQDNNKDLKEKERIRREESKQYEAEAESENNVYGHESDFSNINEPKLFDLQLFGNELYEKYKNKNKQYHEYAHNINAYDISSNCIRTVVFKLLSIPIKAYADKWLPIAMRATIGNAIHDFIQLNTQQLTENEICLKIPSQRVSVRADGLINNNVLVEIKSVPYSDYSKIIKQNKPRTDDFYQSITYKYMLENFLDEAKDESIKISNGNRPKLDNYNIEYIQFIYIAHDLIAADADDLSQALQIMKSVKSQLNSGKNKFFFMTQLAVNVQDIEDYLDYVKTKIEAINYYVYNNKIPSFDDPYVDKTRCFFCYYKNVCNKY